MIESWKEYEGRVVDDKFDLNQYVGHNDDSAVFLTRSLEPENPKAVIKLLVAKPENSDQQLSLWASAARLSHPHLTRLFSMGRCQLGDLPLLYVVMEYADEILSQVLPERPLTPEETHQMLNSALDALAYLHREGFAHGRLKPANILAVGEQVKLSTDRLVRLSEPTRAAVRQGVYDPPEIAGTGISQAGDVWSLGVTTLEALTQYRPVFYGVQQSERASHKTLPAPFGDIVDHCLETDPQRRWTVADIAARLRQTSNTLAEPARVNLTGESKRRYVLPAVAVCVVSVAILLRPMFLDRRPEVQRSSSPRFERATINPGLEQEGAADRQPAFPTSDGPKAGTPHIVPGRVAEEFLPQVPRKASDTIEGKVGVRVRVRVDPSGKVVDSELDSPGPSRYFAGLALNAAKKWRFEPAKIDDRPVTSDWILRFEFRRTGTKVFPVRAAR